MWEELGILEYLLSAPVYSAEGNILREGRRGGLRVTINLAHYELELGISTSALLGES